MSSYINGHASASLLSFLLIPLFHTGHESPELPRIDFLLIRGGGGGGGVREVSYKKNSPIVIVYESVPIQIGFRHEYSGESAQFG